MSRHVTPATTIEHLHREAKRWLKALRARDTKATARFDRWHPKPPANPTLRDVQFALAREHGFDGWASLRARLESPPAVRRYHQVAEALVTAYAQPDEAALAIVWDYFGHRRTRDAMRRYVRLDLGRPEQAPDDDTISLDDARTLVARAQGCPTWTALVGPVEATAGAHLAVKPFHAFDGSAIEPHDAAIGTRDWDELAAWLDDESLTGVHAGGQMTDARLERLTGVAHLTTLRLEGSASLTDAGVRLLARLPRLAHLDLSGCRALTDRALDILPELPALESLDLAWTSVTDAGLAHLSACRRLRSINLMGTPSGDGAIAALAGHANLRDFRSGNQVTAAGLLRLHDIPAYATWLGGEERMELCGFDARPNYLLLRGQFRDEDLVHLAGLEGLFALNVDDSRLGLTGAALPHLIGLPHLAWLAFDAKNDAMPHLAAMPHLRFLMCQDTTADDEGFIALSRSPTIAYIWGRRCHNLRRDGFRALSRMPSLRSLSVSCLNVDDAGLAALPEFPALVELMPMDVPDAGYRHIARCTRLESLVLMYCRETGDEATTHLVHLPALRSYFASYTRITDRTPALLSTIDSLEEVTLDSCAGVTDAGLVHLTRLPRLGRLRVSGMPGVTSTIADAFAAGVVVHSA